MADKITDRDVRNLPAPPSGNRITYDGEVKGFGVRVTKAGAKAFILNYRRKIDGLERRWTIGSFPDWTAGAARDEAKRLKREIDRGADPVGQQQTDRSAPTMADLCTRFEKEYLSRKRPSTQASYKQQIAADILPAMKKLKVAAVTYADVDELHRTISERAPYHANRVLALVSKMFSLAILWRWRTDNPCRGVERNPEHKRKRYLTQAELERLLTALDGLPDEQSANIIRLLLLTGARRGEVLAARWDQFDFTRSEWIKPGATTKQKTDHVVPLSAPAMELLKELKKVAGRAEHLFPSRDGGHRKDVKDSWAALCKAAKIESLRLHDLRHSFASILATGGASLPLIGALLGHTQPSTTARYSHIFDEAQRAAAERVGEVVGGKVR
ncbi:site-specific recombinase XerD [Bradyrhizobium huanghuaihaiense]|uniref:Site-specific recombinase XerD n=1 Tax=Bradyrhizobium huanghuaihaiense TaxID=990078 RepID=A0A562RXJ6_9BRAD|nr:site-specific integrase [Bradyrhizobium huanghuaihaiense]TWI73799.1 site-specific recombinase XerD [Bradyrhizobium huanghuaihaiense]